MTQPHPEVIGIDLGTTFSCVAHVTAEGVPTTIPNREGELVTPSVVLLEDDLVIVGREAKRNECLAPDRTAVCVKRDMGLPAYSRLVAGQQYRPEVLSAWILKRLRDDAITRLGHVEHAVITVPAYFDDTRRKATQDAGKIAGLDVIDILNEPTAAALAYAYQSHLRGGDLGTFVDELSRKSVTALVYDLGGGTFDVSIVRMSRSRFETLATDGDVRLGGRDWDDRLVNFAAEEFEKQHGTDPRADPESLALLFQSAEQAKHALSVRQATRMLVVHDAKRLSLDVTREQFERLTRSLLTRTQMTTELVVESAKLTWNDIDRVLLVGGMTRAPQVREMLKRVTGGEPNVGLAADEVVAHGAALHGALLMSKSASGFRPQALQAWDDFTTVDVNSHSLGIAVRSHGGYANSVLIPKNTALPVSRSRTYLTSIPNQRQVRVRVLEGEAHEADACVEIGEFIMRNLPGNLPVHSPVEVSVHYGSDGRISVTGRDPSSGRLTETQIQRRGGMSDEDIARETERLQLKPVN